MQQWQMQFSKFQFVVQSVDDIVGATIGRPAVQCCDFAENRCEYEIFCRAGGGSPPLHSLNYRGAINSNPSNDCINRPGLWNTGRVICYLGARLLLQVR